MPQDLTAARAAPTIAAMARKPFDPDRMLFEPPPQKKTPDRRNPLSVSDVAALLHAVLREHVPATLQVVGEVSNLSDRTHWFFSLKDEQASLRCVMFASAARRARAQGVRLEDGQLIVATGRLDYYDAQGQLQLYVDRVEQAGQGALEQQFRMLCTQLRELGYFAVERKRLLPSVPRGVAVVTSRSAAALQDVIHTARKRWPGCRLMFFDVRVQGSDAAPQIAAAIDAVSSGGAEHGIDVILLTRGGGSMEDLWAFNERVVADAVFRCRLPVVAAIGHETDTTVAELVADLRCATPTQAAMQVVPDASALRHQVDQTAGRLGASLSRGLAEARRRLEAASRSRIYRQPLAIIEPMRDGLEQHRSALTRGIGDRIAKARAGLSDQRLYLERIEPRGRLRLAVQQLRAMARRLRAATATQSSRRRDGLEALQRRLEVLGPGNVLRRGYSYTTGPDGELLRSVDQVARGDRIRTTLAEGSFGSVVDRAPGAGKASGQSRKPQAGDDGEPQLFG